MWVTCQKCNRDYDDAACWTICPHGPLWADYDAYCVRCDLCRPCACGAQTDDPREQLEAELRQAEQYHAECLEREQKAEEAAADARVDEIAARLGLQRARTALDRHLQQVSGATTPDEGAMGVD